MAKIKTMTITVAKTRQEVQFEPVMVQASLEVKIEDGDDPVELRRSMTEELIEEVRVAVGYAAKTPDTEPTSGRSISDTPEDRSDVGSDEEEEVTKPAKKTTKKDAKKATKAAEEKPAKEKKKAKKAKAKAEPEVEEDEDSEITFEQVKDAITTAVSKGKYPAPMIKKLMAAEFNAVRMGEIQEQDYGKFLARLAAAEADPDNFVIGG